MLPEGFDLRTQFPAGEQVKVTPAIRELSNQFRELHYPNGFQNIHDYIFGRIKIVPYEESVKAYERTRRWKLTADDLLRVGTVVDTKLEFGTKLPNDWILWKADVDQWAMGLNDSSQETTTIMADAKKLLGITA